MHELLTYTDTDFIDLSVLMHELSGNIVFTKESLERMLADGNSHLYVAREEGRIIACACLCIYHQPFSTDATIESVVVSSKMRGKGLGRKLMEHLIEEVANSTNSPTEFREGMFASDYFNFVCDGSLIYTFYG